MLRQRSVQGPFWKLPERPLVDPMWLHDRSQAETWKRHWIVQIVAASSVRQQERFAAPHRPRRNGTEILTTTSVPERSSLPISKHDTEVAEANVLRR